MKTIFEFLFGKKPPIFNGNSKVEHRLNEERWSQWQNQYLHNEEYNWHAHEGTHYKNDSSSK